MQVHDHWPEIKRIVARAQASTIHCAIASIGLDGLPHVTPVGTVFPRDDMTGYYFDHYTSTLVRNIEANPMFA